jgi:hypothetical protein
LLPARSIDYDSRWDSTIISPERMVSIHWQPTIEGKNVDSPLAGWYDLPSGKRLNNELENQHAINGKPTISLWPCSIATVSLPEGMFLAEKTQRLGCASSCHQVSTQRVWFIDVAISRRTHVYTCAVYMLYIYYWYSYRYEKTYIYIASSGNLRCPNIISATPAPFHDTRWNLPPQYSSQIQETNWSWVTAMMGKHNIQEIHVPG